MYVPRQTRVRATRIVFKTESYSRVLNGRVRNINVLADLTNVLLYTFETLTSVVTTPSHRIFSPFIVVRFSSYKVLSTSRIFVSQPAQVLGLRLQRETSDPMRKVTDNNLVPGTFVPK